MTKPHPSQRIEYLTRYGFIFFLILLMLTALITALLQGKLHQPFFKTNYQYVQQQNLQAISQDINAYYFAHGYLPSDLYAIGNQPYNIDPQTNELYIYYVLSSMSYELCPSSYHEYHPVFWFFDSEDSDMNNCSTYTVPQSTQ